MKKIYISIICLLFFSCSASIPTEDISADYLSNETASSKTADLSVQIPKDWFVAEDNECKCTDLWLIKNDYTQSFVFRKINFDSITMSQIQINEIPKAADFNKMFVKAELGKDFKNFSNEETFEINGSEFSAYQYLGKDGNSIRTVVFKLHGILFEMAAISKNRRFPETLYNVQNAVLSTLN